MKITSSVFGFLLATTSISFTATQAILDASGAEYRYQSFKDCRDVFEQVEQGELAGYVDQIKNGTGGAGKRRECLLKLARVQSALDALETLGYKSQGSGTDKRITHITRDMSGTEFDVAVLPEVLADEDVLSADFASRYHALKDFEPGTLPKLRTKISASPKSRYIAKLMQAAASVYKIESAQGYRSGNQSSPTMRKVAGIRRDLEDMAPLSMTELMPYLVRLTGQRSDQGESVFRATSGQTYPCGSASDRKKIFDQNRRIAQHGFELNGRAYKLNTADMVKRAEIVINQDNGYGESCLQYNDPKYAQTDLFVKNAHFYDVAVEMKNRGLNPMILDLANASMPGGAAANGRGNVQEEIMVYSSNLYEALKKLSDDNAAHVRKVTAAGGTYDSNFLPRDGGAIIPGVEFFRKWDGMGSRESYAFQEPVAFDVFAAAAFRHKSRRDLGKGVDEDVYPEIKDETTYWYMIKNKIRAMFAAAAENGNDSLVLGAFGNGAFGNPVPETVKVFREVLEEFKGYFKEIRFAVLCPKHDDRTYQGYKVLEPR